MCNCFNSFAFRMAKTQSSFDHSKRNKINYYKILFKGNICAACARGYKTFFMLNSAENEIFSAYEKLNSINLNFFPALQN